jgi:5-(carboxyamino)imidazole ribonucleotide synthase
MVKVGILGGGQLGRMLLQASANYQVEVHVMENDPECPAATLTSNFKLGDIRNFDDVVSFGSTLDALTIEIENVNLNMHLHFNIDVVSVETQTNLRLNCATYDG